MDALRMWAGARAWPYPAIPSDGHARAFDYAQAVLAPAQGLQQQRGGRARGPDGVTPESEVLAAAPGWRALGPMNVGGRTLALAFNPQNPSTLWAGSASGGLWRSATGGRGAAAWTYVPTGFPVLAVSSIAVDPADSNTILIGTGEVYGHQAADGGVAERLARGSYGIGILKSNDGGRTWVKSLDWSRHQQRGVWKVALDPLNRSRVWAATTEGVYRSSDGGSSWTQLLDVIMATDLEIHPTHPDTVYAACGNLLSAGRGVYRSTDGGATWSLLANGWPGDFEGKIELALAPSAPRTIFASVGVFARTGTTLIDGKGSWLLRSLDGGDTWTVQTSQDYAIYQGWYSHDVAVHPLDPQRVYFAGLDIWRSDDAGANPRQISFQQNGFNGPVPPGGPEGEPTYSHADHHVLLFHPTNPDVLYEANDGGVFRTLDGGATWQGCNGGYQSSQFYNGFSSSPQDTVPAIGGLQDNSTVIYQGGPAWSRVIGGDGGWAAIDPRGASTMYGTIQYMSLWRSTNGGASFANISPPPVGDVAFIAPFVVSPAFTQALYAGRDVVYRSLDRGGSWTAGGALNGNPLLCLATSTKNVALLYAGAVPTPAGHHVFLSADRATTWLDISAGLPNRYPMDIAIDPVDELTAYVVLSGFGTSHLFRTGNGGASWEDIGTTLPDVPTSAVLLDPEQPVTIYVGNDLGVYASQDGGGSWQALGDGLPDAVIVMDLSLVPGARRLRVATHGNGVYERPLLPPAPSTPQRAGVVLEQNHPNPFNPRTTIEFTLARSAPVTLAIFDAAGRRVRTLLRGEMRSAGGNSADWDGTDEAGRRVASGTYYYRIEANAASQARAMTLVK